MNVTQEMDQFLSGEQARAKSLPHCFCCSKQSDGCKIVTRFLHNHVLCGTCIDAWGKSAERHRAGQDWNRGGTHFMDFINRRRAELANGSKR